MSVFGVYGVPMASHAIYLGLHALQHRGQEGAGMAVFGEDGLCRHHRGLGLAGEIFSEARLMELEGSMGIGSNQYANAKKGGMDNVQPLFFRHNTGNFAVAGEGSLVNSPQIISYLEERGCIFQTDTDAEILAQLMKKGAEPGDRIDRILQALNMLEGGFAFLVLTRNRIYAARDKYGIKPLAIGRLGNGWVVSSETCAFSLVGADFVRDVEPGEVVCIDSKGLRSSRYSLFQKYKVCAMEYIYIARPDSDIDGCNVHNYRKETRLCRGKRHTIRDGARQEPLCGKDLHPAFPADEGKGRPAETLRRKQHRFRKAAGAGG